MEMIENEFNEDWVKVEDEQFIKMIKCCLVGTEDDFIRLEWIASTPTETPDGLKHLDKPHYIVKLHGGRNGDGNWTRYLSDMNLIFLKLKEIFNRVYLLTWENDCPDDVFDVRIVCGDRKID